MGCGQNIFLLISFLGINDILNLIMSGNSSLIGHETIPCGLYLVYKNYHRTNLYEPCKGLRQKKILI